MRGSGLDLQTMCRNIKTLANFQPPATQDEIRKAYRRLAKENHPDLNPGDKGAEARFKEIASAYDVVGDEKKRARYDSGEIDASGVERQQPEREFYRQRAEAGPGTRYERSWSRTGPDDADLFAELFGARGARTKATGRTSTTHSPSNSRRPRTGRRNAS